MIRVADFFENKSIDGILWSSALALSEPRNATVALDVYNEVAGKMARPIDVTRRIEEMIGRQQRPQLTIVPKRADAGAVDGEFREVDLDDSPMARFITPPSAVVEEVAKPIQHDLVDESPSSLITINIKSPMHNVVTREYLDYMVDTILKDLDFMTRAERLRLWRAFIRKEER
jgi:hypothetical protein